MSDLRDIRLIIVRHLDLPQITRAAVMDVLNRLDAQLDSEGFESNDEVKASIAFLNRTIIGDEDDADNAMDEADDDDFVALDFLGGRDNADDTDE